MIYIIIAIIAIGLVVALVKWLVGVIAQIWPFLIAAAVLVISYFAFSWAGVLTVIAVAAAVALIWVIGRSIKETIEKHDRMKNETAKIKKQTQSEQIIHDNDSALLQELQNNCIWLGYMDEKGWKAKLPNFADKSYSTSFEEITANFAKQIQQQYILQNDDWFEPYKKYVLNNPGGSTVTKMMEEVDCPQLKMTHYVKDGDLINTRLMKGTNKKNMDVPALFNVTFIKDMNENLFTPTPYLVKLYGSAEETEEVKVNHTEELNFDDL
ncbi:MAG: hypothetical protein LUI14_07440 [Lachnospiraceae bacterium]|nr:hypothetical protein [Lachnospiraceae bacterium]